MDRRMRNNKHKSNRNEVKIKRPTLSLQKRNELSALVSSLLDIGFKQASNPNEEWQQFLDIRKILDRVVVLESVLKRKSANATAESRLANINVFYKWASENGIKYNGLKISQFPGYELGLEATRDIKQGDKLLCIPRKVILSEENLDKDLRQSQFDTMSNLKLAYALMLESLKPDGFWKPYIDLLPDEYSTVLYCSVAEMEELRGSNALSQALRQCKAIARQYAFIYNIAQSTPYQEKITPVAQHFKDAFCYDLYRWAVSTVMTRENMIPRSTASSDIKWTGSSGPHPDIIAALIPFWDMANHKHGKITSFFDLQEHKMECTAQTDVKQGEQIFIHYGDRSNAELMIHNSFVNPNNPKDSVSIKFGLSTSDPLFAKRAQLLEMLQIAKFGELELLPAPEYISPKLLGFMRVFNMQLDQLEHWIQSERATDLMHIDCALETSLDSKSWQFLHTRLMLLLRVFPTTLADDEAKLAQHRRGELELSYAASMFLQYRIIEKRILTNALDYAEQRTKA